MADILVTKPNVLNRDDKARLRKAGIVHVTADNPDDVRFIHPGMPAMNGNDLLFSAISALASTSHDGPRELFVKALFATMKANRDD